MQNRAEGVKTPPCRPSTSPPSGPKSPPCSQKDPHQKHEEDEKDIGDKVGRSKDAVGIIDSIVVKVPKDDPELSETERPGSGFYPEPNHNPDPNPYPIHFPNCSLVDSDPSLHLQPNPVETGQDAQILERTHLGLQRPSHRCFKHRHAHVNIPSFPKATNTHGVRG